MDKIREIERQIGFEETSQEYAQFVDKFKPKKTTDDCYTTTEVYEAVADWVREKYGIARERMVRPFYPGGDYERQSYKMSDVVVDNPPFSIITKIISFYQLHDIPFFLFAPTLTLFSIGRKNDVSFLPLGADVTYENGAKVNTSFVTNLEREYRIMIPPDLVSAIKKANEQKKQNKKITPYVYPDNVVSAALLQKIGDRGVPLYIKKTDCVWIHKLDSQKGKGIFGGGYLLSDQAAADRAAADRAAADRAAAVEAIEWTLSNREKEIIKALGK
ncbi:MAG: hypothetical protein ACI4V3_07095 [Faecousia sp.]